MPPLDPFVWLVVGAMGVFMVVLATVSQISKG